MAHNKDFITETKTTGIVNFSTVYTVKPPFQVSFGSSGFEH
jgi:hypothetical protein